MADEKRERDPYRAAELMRNMIGRTIEAYAQGCEDNADKQAGRLAAGVARSIGRIVADIPPGAALILPATEVKP